jgi:hypothetical protein
MARVTAAEKLNTVNPMTDLDAILREVKKRNPEWSLIFEAATKEAVKSELLSAAREIEPDTQMVMTDPELAHAYRVGFADALKLVAGRANG